MSKTLNHEEMMDPRLEGKLELLRGIPERDPEAAARGRERFLAELDSIPELNASSRPSWLAGLFKPKLIVEEDNSMTTRTQKFAISTILVVIVILVFLFGGAGATAYAAQSALPGDALYSVKTGLEQTRITLARNAYTQAQLNMAFAERRLEEITALIREGRFNDIGTASAEFEYQVQQAMRAMQTVMAGDPQRGAELSNQVSEALLRYAQALKGAAVNVPEEVRPALEKAILVSEDSAGEVEFTGVVEAMSGTTWTIGGRVVEVSALTEIKDSVVVGATVKVHATTSADGTLVAREIELHTDEGVGVDNDNDNVGNDNDNVGNDNDNVGNDNDNVGNDNDNVGNDNDNVGNDNDNVGNDNDNVGNDNGNENDNDNVGNDNGNENDNDNVGNDNGNENDNDNVDNDNGNENDNDNVDNDNGNENDNDNVDNDNGGGDEGNDNSFNPITFLPIAFQAWITDINLA